MGSRFAKNVCLSMLNLLLFVSASGGFKNGDEGKDQEYEKHDYRGAETIHLIQEQRA